MESNENAGDFQGDEMNDKGAHTSGEMNEMEMVGGEEELEALSEDVLAFNTVDVERNVLENANKVMEEQQKKRENKILQDLKMVQDEISTLEKDVKTCEKNDNQKDNEKKNLMKRKLKSAKNKEKNLLSQLERLDVQKQQKSIDIVMNQDEESETDKLIRMGVITPFGNTISGPTTISVPPASSTTGHPSLSSFDTNQNNSNMNEINSRNIRRRIHEKSEDSYDDLNGFIVDDDEDEDELSQNGKQYKKRYSDHSNYHSSSDDDGDDGSDQSFVNDDIDEDVGVDFVSDENTPTDKENLSTNEPKQKRRRIGTKMAQEDEEYQAQDLSTLDDGSDEIYNSRIEKYNSTRNSNLQNISDTIIDGGLKIPGEIYTKLFDYQRTGIKWLWELHCQKTGGILGDEMGLGKTVQITCFLAALHHSKKFLPTLIITPGTVMKQWVREIHEWYPPLRVAIFHSSGSATGSKYNILRKILKKESPGVLITTFDAVRLNQELLIPQSWGYVIMDEGHKIRNPDSEVTLACKRFETPHRLILTGTPIQNNLKELWSLFDFVFPGKLGTLPVFQSQFGIPISLGGYSNASPFQVQTAYKCAVILRDLISPYLLRRLKKDVHHQLPKKEEKVLFCKLTKYQVGMYKDFLGSKSIDQYLVSKTLMFGAISSLRQICNHPDIVEKSKTKFRKENIDSDVDANFSNMNDEYGAIWKSGKLKVVSQLLALWKPKGHRVLLYSHSIQMLNIMEMMSKQYNYSYVRMDGSTNIKERIPLIDKFNSDKSIFIFLLSTKVGGIGVNLTGADRIILYDPDWNPSIDHQALERAWRIGQTKDVIVYRLMTSGTIEEKMYHRQIFKQFLSNKILNDPRQRRFFKSNELHELFTLGPEYNEYLYPNKGKNRLKRNVINETSEIFKGINSQITSSQFEKMKSKNPQEFENDLAIGIEYNSISEESNNQGNQESEEKENEKKNEAFILKQLLENKGINSIFNHDKIIGSSTLEKKLVEDEASQIAKIAAEKLKQSTLMCRSFNNLTTPTWTGKSGLAGVSTFGSKTGSLAQFGQRRSNSLVSNQDPQSSPTSSSLILGQIGQGIRHNENEMNEESSKKVESQMIQQLQSFLRERGGKSTSSQLVSSFEDTVSGERIILFKYLLKQIATFDKGTKVWTLKPSYK